MEERANDRARENGNIEKGNKQASKQIIWKNLVAKEEREQFLGAKIGLNFIAKICSNFMMK